MAANILGKLLKKLRKEHGERLEDMAEKLGITPSCLSAVSTGRRQLTPKLFEKLKKSYPLSDFRAEQIAMAADFCREQIKIPCKDLNSIQRQLCAILAANIRSADRQAAAKCCRALGIDPKELQKWVGLFKMNQEDYRPFQQVIAALQRGEARRSLRRRLLNELQSQELPAARIALRELQNRYDKLSRRPLPEEELQGLQNSINLLNRQLERIVGRLDSLTAPNGGALPASPPLREAEDDGVPGQEILDL